MDNSVLIIEMPNLSDEAVACIQDFLWELIRAFESSYFQQLQQYYQNKEEHYSE